MLLDSRWGLLLIFTVIMLYAATRWVQWNLLTTIWKTIISCTDWCIKCTNRCWEVTTLRSVGSRVIWEWEGLPSSDETCIINPCTVPWLVSINQRKNVLSMKWILENWVSRAETFDGEARKVEKRNNAIRPKWRSGNKQVTYWTYADNRWVSHGR